MSRLGRRNRTGEDLGLLDSGGMLDVIDNTVKSAFRINDKEYDFIADKLTNEEMELFLNENKSFSEKRKTLVLLEKYLRMLE